MSNLDSFLNQDLSTLPKEVIASHLKEVKEIEDYLEVEVFFENDSLLVGVDLDGDYPLSEAVDKSNKILSWLVDNGARVKQEIGSSFLEDVNEALAATNKAAITTAQLVDMVELDSLDVNSGAFVLWYFVTGVEGHEFIEVTYDDDFNVCDIAFSSPN